MIDCRLEWILGLKPYKNEIHNNRGPPADNTDFVIYRYNGQELYAIVKDHYFRSRDWKPHVSVLNVNELNTHANQIYNELIVNSTNDDKTNYLRRTIGQVNPISNILINRDVAKLRLGTRFNNGRPQIDIDL